MVIQEGVVNDNIYLDAMLEVTGDGKKLTRRYLLCQEPVHIGEGGYRMGHIDNTIMRDKPTGLPIVPGSSIKGTVRQGAFLWLAENLFKQGKVARETVLEKAEDICRQIFGRIDDQDANQVSGSGKKGAQAGLARFYDLFPVFFPVLSVSGPVWLTSPELVAKWLGMTVSGKLQLEEGAVYPLSEEMCSFAETVRLGWLNLKVDRSIKITLAKQPPPPIQQLLMCTPGTFSRLVRDNMEVRTSVKINRESGAAESGALFTYEAIPRLTVLGLEILWPGSTIYGIVSPLDQEITDGISLLNIWLQRLQTLGLGGFGNKGFGRVKLLAEKGGKE